MSGLAYFEDFTVGQVFLSGVYPMEKAKIIAFAAEFDPQPAHIGEAGAADSQFGRLVASGWHTAAVAMRLMITGALPPIAGGGVGLGVEDLSWALPVYPGDELRIKVEITGARTLRSRPGKALMNVRVEMTNQDDAIVLRMATTMVLLIRPE